MEITPCRVEESSACAGRSCMFISRPLNPRGHIQQRLHLFCQPCQSQTVNACLPDMPTALTTRSLFYQHRQRYRHYRRIKHMINTYHHILPCAAGSKDTPTESGESWSGRRRGPFRGGSVTIQASDGEPLFDRTCSDELQGDLHKIKKKAGRVPDATYASGLCLRCRGPCSM